MHFFALGERSNIIMTLRRGEGVCSNRQSAVIWGEKGLTKSSYYFYCGWKSL